MKTGPLTFEQLLATKPKALGRCERTYKPAGKRYASRCKEQAVRAFGDGCGTRELCAECARRSGWVK